jgi:UDP-N-acetylmuramoylalanine--D-glutamate ligase
VSVTVYDRRLSAEAISEGFGVASGEWDHLLLRGIDLVIASPGFSERSVPVVETMEWGVPLVGEVEYAWEHLKSPVIAVTGTNGKTTVTEATSAMLEASGLAAPVAGNIGVPLSDFADEVYDALVTEVSSFQLRFTEAFHPVAAGITNVSLDHLDWHGSSYSYREAKARIFANQTSEDLLVYDADDPGATELAAGAPSFRYPVSGRRLPEEGGGIEDGVLAVMDVSVDTDKLHSQDPMHLGNIGMAMALARRLGATPEGITRAATSYQPGAHRRELVAEVEGVSWVDDSKATNPHAALASIRSFQSVILIAGGLAKGLDVAPLGQEPNVRLVLGIGEAGPSIVGAAGPKGHNVQTLESAMEFAVQEARAGDTVLLAPGCASFDQFDSYASRGERFGELVRSATGGAG